MEENNKQAGLDPEAKTEKLEATPADQGQADATEKLPATEIPADKPKVAKMETAEHRIEKSLAKQGVEHGEGDVHDALIPLYERYELTGAMPTQEAFAEACRNQNAGQHVKDMPKDPFRPTGKRNALIAAGCVVAAAAIIAGGAFAYSQLTKPAEPSHTTPSTATVQQKEDGKVSVKVNCDGWNADTSTPIVVSVYSGDVKDTLTSTDENTVAPDPLFTKEVEAGVETDLDDIKDNGTYTIAVTGSPILDDGTIFDLPEPQVVDFDTAKGASVEITLIAKAADQVTEADIAAAQAAAVASGADAEKVSAKASNATSKAASAQGGTVASGTANAATKSNANKTGTTIPSSNNNQQGNNQGSNTGSSTGNTTQTHQHNWVPQTTTAHHDAVYKTETSYIHHDAVIQDVYVCACGNEFDTSSALSAHQKQYRLQGISGHGSSSVKEKVIKNAYDEPVTKQVLVSAAYDETVTTGYKCSGCGATKSN